jgi:tetratricopeptide (TPR) repeat protein
VIESLFGIALQLEDQELAKIYIDIAVEKNIDLCEGKMFKARLDMFDEDYQNAIIKLTDCLKLRPTLSLIYMLRSQCYSKIDNHQEAIDDAKTATQMNPFDGNVAKNYASVIYTRNSQLGAGVTKEQRQELLPALREAIRSNPGAWQIQSMYAETVAKDDPEKALDVYQRLVKIHPNLQTYMQLGSMSLKMAMRQTVTSEKEFHLQAAEKAFQNAYAIDPSDQDLLNMYSEYYRLTGQPEKVAELFSGKKESMWKFHLRDGQNEKALKVLQEQYDNDPENTSTLIGLVTVSQRMDAKEDLIRYSEELLKIDDNLENKLLQIQMFLSMGLASETEAKLESLKKNHPDDDRVLLAEAGTTLIKGKPAQALEFLNEYIQKHPNNTNALQLRARVNGTLGDFEQVINDLQKCIQISPSPEVQYLLAQTQARLGNITFAIGILNEVLKDGRAPVKARRLLETIYRKYNKRSELFPFYDETLQKYPNSIYWKLRAGTFLSSNGRYDKAEELLLGAWELSQKQGGGINILSEYLSTLMTAKKYKQAQKFATEQINGKFAPIAYAYLGMIQIEYKEKEKAKEYFYKSLEKAENDSSFIAGILGKMLQFFDQKVVSDWCNSRLEKDPTSLPANITMFRLYQGSNDYDNALKYINKCLDSVDKNGNQWRFFSSEKATHLTVAYMKTSEKRFLQQAIVSYEDILKASPNNTDVMNNLAYLLADNNEKNEDAVNYARTAYKSRPNDTNRMDTYAYALYRIGDYKKAEELLLSAIAICQQRNTQPDWGVYKHLAMTQEALGKKSEAIKHYDQALELAGNNISAKEKEQIEKELDRLTGN